MNCTTFTNSTRFEVKSSVVVDQHHSITQNWIMNSLQPLMTKLMMINQSRWKENINFIAQNTFTTTVINRMKELVYNTDQNNNN